MEWRREIKQILEYFFFIVVGLYIAFKDKRFFARLIAYIRGEKSPLTNIPSVTLPAVEKERERLKNKAWSERPVAIVTGANSGIGVETARLIASAGYHVILACRTISTAKSAEEHIRSVNEKLGHPCSVEVIQLDLSDLKSVNEFAQKVKTKYGDRLRLLINNAGVMFVPFSLSKQGYEMHYAHIVGTMCLSLLLVDTLIKNGTANEPSRIVNLVSDTLHFGRVRLDDLTRPNDPDVRRNHHRWWWYCDSKAAQTAITLEFHRQLRAKNIQSLNVYAVHPGSIVSGITREAGSIIVFLMRLVGQLGLLLPTEVGAMPAVYAALSEHFSQQSGLYLSMCDIEHLHHSDINNSKLREELWQTTMKLCGVSTSCGL